MRRFLGRFLRSDKGSVAPTVGLSLFALIAVGGIAFDYSRVAAMDTELQNAADQAALAAATQLDGDPGAQTRATSAATTLITNQTRMANDQGSANVGIASVTFYSAYTGPTSNTLATGDSDSNFVRVTVNNRTANFAFTPVVSAFSGSTNASAVAGLSSAICGVVPFFICNPVEPAGNTDPNYAPGGTPTGAGMVLYEGGSSWGPGNFGFLDQIGNGANGVSEALASNGLFGDCQATSQVITKPGNFIAAVRDSLNTRFDFSGNGSTCKQPPCSPSTNVAKDVVRGSSCNWAQNAATAANMATNAPPRYFPDSPIADLPTSVIPQIMGHPRDRCHYFNPSKNNPSYPFCAGGRIGDGNWDRAAYFRSNHAGTLYTSVPGLDANGDGIVTRYEVYLWEAGDPINRLQTKSGQGGTSAYPTPQTGACLAPGLAPNPSGSDRRRITAAVVNCRAVAQSTGLNGKKTLPVAGYIDLFLVEPVINRTKCPNCTVSYGGNTYAPDYSDDKDIYVEVIGAAGTGQGGAVPQISRRDVPRLIE
ncbi:TadE/TadG family type IV pilus assembly protein [Sphingomonas daechungensis]|uniref:TadE/TadG family type IV pilus assembly protein n=1 Tax=Sphingomonas daechungensis TaxID=1176646 RepID=UPI003784A51F